MSSSPKETIPVTRLGLAVCAIVLFGAFVRLYDLDRMAYHHDESIHAYYAHQFYKGNYQHTYDPTYHGQFLFHFGGLFFVLFGDYDYVGRLPYVCVGIFMFYLVWRLRPWIGTSGALACLLLTATSPTLIYFSRFARNDIYMAAWAAGLVLFALEYFRSRRGGHLAGMALFLALLYCTKENSYMTGFMLGSFVTLYGVFYYFSYQAEIRKKALYEIFAERAPFVKVLTLYGLFSAAAFSLVFWQTTREDFKNYAQQLRGAWGTPDLTIGILRETWNRFNEAHPRLIPLWVAGSALAVAGLFLLFAYLRRTASDTPREGSWFTRLAKNNLPVLCAVLVAFAVYAFLFTNMGHYPAGMKAGVVDYLLYWMGQQGMQPRIAGPPDYYLPRLLLYEPVMIFFAALAFVVYTWKAFGPAHFAAFQIAFWASVYTYGKVVLLKSGNPLSIVLMWFIAVCIAIGIVLARKMAGLFSFIPAGLLNQEPAGEEGESRFSPDGLRIFFLYWSVLSLLIYALLNEKVPWLMVHQVQPLALLAGVFIGDLWDAVPAGWLRKFYTVVLGLFLVYAMRTGVQLNLLRPDDPRELMVYTQTGHFVKEVVREIREGAERLGPEYMPPHPSKLIAAFQGESQWPYYWYFRNYMITPTDGMPPANIPYAVVDTGLEDNMKVWAKGQYTKRRVKHRLWWPPPPADRLGTPALMHELPFNYALRRNLPPSEGWRMLWNYILYRQVWDPQDPSIQPSSTDTLFYAKTPLIAPEETLQVAQGYEKPAVPLAVVKMAGQFGSELGQFNEPRGVALSPDEKLLYVLDARNGRIQVFDTDLNFVGYFGGPGTGLGELRVFYQYGNGPNGGIGTGPDGTIYVTDTWAEGNGRINRYNASGQPLPPLAPPPADSFYFPRGLAVTKEGVVYVTDTGKHRVVKFNPDGTYAGAVIQGVLQEPVGITLGLDGLLYICDVGMKRVAAFTAQGRFVRQLSLLGWKVSNDAALSWIEPYVAVDAKGFVYATDSTTNTVHRFEPGGKAVTQAGGEGNGPGQLRGPKGITVDGQGNLYIADSYNHRVVKARFP